MQTGNLGIVEWLMYVGNVDVNAKAVDGSTALHYAVRYDNLNIVRALVEGNADVNQETSNGETDS